MLLVNNPGYDAFGKKGWSERLANGRLPNVRHLVGPTDALGMGEDTLDGAVIVMSYHDLYWVDDAEGWPKVDAGQFLDQVARAQARRRAAGGRPQRALRHRQQRGADPAPHRRAVRHRRFPQARPGMGRGDAYPRNPDDDRGKPVFDPSIRGKTDRFVHLYRKPG